MKEAVLYVHGKGGSVAESEHYKTLFPECEVVGVDYQTFTPWETGAEIRAAVEAMKAEDKRVILITNSIGAYFSMNAGIDAIIKKAWFISPIVDMEKLITDMMRGGQCHGSGAGSQGNHSYRVWREPVLELPLLCAKPSHSLDGTDADPLWKP